MRFVISKSILRRARYFHDQLCTGKPFQNNSRNARPIRTVGHDDVDLFFAMELQAATDLAKLWGEQRKPTEARNLLAPIYEQFTEGFAEPSLRDAKALLEAL